MQREPIRVIRIKEVGGIQTGLLERFATDIYDLSFNKQHREPSENWMQRLRDRSGPPQQHAALALESGRVVGGCLSETYPGEVELLTYVAVHSEHRGRGIGGVLMRELLQHHAGMPLFAEMEDPSRVATSAERKNSVLRARFFHRWGWKAVRAAYAQPPLEQDAQWADDLLLLHRPGNAAPSLGRGALEALNEGLRKSLGAGSERQQLSVAPTPPRPPESSSVPQ